MTVYVKGQVSKLPGRFKEPGGSLATQELSVSRGAYGSHITEDSQALWICKSLRDFQSALRLPDGTDVKTGFEGVPTVGFKHPRGISPGERSSARGTRRGSSLWDVNK